MLKSTTSSQSSAPATPYNVENGVVTSSDGRWNQVDSTNMMQNITPPEWNVLTPQSFAPVPLPTNNVSSETEYHVTSSINNVNNVNILCNQVVYNPPNYLDLNYQRNAVTNGSTTVNPGRLISPPVINGSNQLSAQNRQITGGQAWSNASPLGRLISPGWASSKPNGVKKPKRIRTAFTSQQMMALEQEYARTRYLERTRRIELAGILHLNERTIKIWFQNRRMKEKKDRAESMEDSEDAGTNESSPEMGNIPTNHRPMLIHEQYSAMKNGVYSSAQYPVTSTPAAMPAPSLPPSMPVQNTYQEFMSEEERQAQYQQVHVQEQLYQSRYIQVEELVTEDESKAENPTQSAPSDNIENWDLSWIRSYMQFD